MCSTTRRIIQTNLSNPGHPIQEPRLTAIAPRSQRHLTLRIDLTTRSQNLLRLPMSLTKASNHRGEGDSSALERIEVVPRDRLDICRTDNVVDACPTLR